MTPARAAFLLTPFSLAAAILSAGLVFALGEPAEAAGQPAPARSAAFRTAIQEPASVLRPSPTGNSIGMGASWRMPGTTMRLWLLSVRSATRTTR